MGDFINCHSTHSYNIASKLFQPYLRVGAMYSPNQNRQKKIQIIHPYFSCWDSMPAAQRCTVWLYTRYGLVCTLAGQGQGAILCPIIKHMNILCKYSFTDFKMSSIFFILNLSHGIPADKKKQVFIPKITTTEVWAGSDQSTLPIHLKEILQLLTGNFLKR